MLATAVDLELVLEILGVIALILVIIALLRGWRP